MRDHNPTILTIVFLGAFGCAQVLGYDDLSFGGPDAGSGGVPDAGKDAAPDAPGGSAGATGGTAGSAGTATGGTDTGGTGGTGGSAGSAGSGGTSIPCTGQGPAYIHGDLWAFWHNSRVACDAQNRWVWICQQRLGPGNCSIEAQRFQDCWNAKGEFPPTSWGGDSTPTPHSASSSVCQPHQWPEKNLPAARPGNEVPCDTTTFNYDNLRRQDPFYGVDWSTNHVSVRHLTLKAFASGQDPLANQGQSDGLLALSSHPSNKAALMDGIDNHSYPGHVSGGGCLPPLTGDQEEPYPAQSVGAFFWLEVPTDQPVTISASWIGPTGDVWDPVCLTENVYGFPQTFSYHSVDGKPWFISSPCYDVLQNVKLEPGRHYLWDMNGFRALPDCSGPPANLLELVPVSLRPSFKDGSCSSM